MRLRRRPPEIDRDEAWEGFLTFCDRNNIPDDDDRDERFEAWVAEMIESNEPECH